MTRLLQSAFCTLLLAGCLKPHGPDVRPVAGSWVIVVRESADQTPEQARLLESMLVALQKEGREMRIYDPQDRLGDALVVDALGYAKHVKAHGLPTLIVTDGRGKVLSAGKLPPSETEVMAAIRRALR